MNPKPDLHADDPIHIKTLQSEVIVTHPHSETYEGYPALYVCLTDDETATEPSELSEDDPPERSSRVRFRDRVRITSGLNRHRHKESRSEHADYIHLSRSSSRSGSRSSSISVPLRNEIEYADAKPGWGTLGQRVAIMAQHHAERKMERQQRDRELLAKSIQLGTRFSRGEYGTERTPLIKSATYVQIYMPPNDTGCDSPIKTASEREEYLAREIDIAFGTWPHRLWNHHVCLLQILFFQKLTWALIKQWWWWHIEPVMCCQCLTEFEDERY